MSGDLEPRVEALEHQVRDLTNRVRASEQDAAAARVLAGAADRDVGEIRGELRDFRQATSGSFNALRRDFVEFRTHVDQRFAEVDQQFATSVSMLIAASSRCAGSSTVPPPAKSGSLT